MKLKTWLENYWYHYKVHTLVFVFIIIVAVFGIKSCVQKQPIDLVVYYISENAIVYPEQKAALMNSIQKYADDYDGDGNVMITIQQYAIGPNVDPKLVGDFKKEIATAYQAGGIMMMACDKYGADYLSSVGFFGNIIDICPSAEYDGTVWNTENSEFIKSDSIKDWGDTPLYFGLRVYNEKSVINMQKDAKDRYIYAKKILENMIH